MRSLAIESVRGETDYLRRQNNRFLQKQKKLRSIKIRGVHLFVIILAISFIAFLIYRSAQFILTWEKFNVHHFTFVHRPEAHGADIDRILAKYKGYNILSLNPEMLRTDLKTIPEIADVDIKRNLPDALEISFLLKKPVYQLEINGKFMIMDADGVQLYSSPRKKENLIDVRAVTVTDMRNVAPFSSSLNEIRNNIEFITWKSPYGIILKLHNLPETIYPGDRDYYSKVEHYLKYRQRLPIELESVKNVDLRFKDRFYLEFQEEVTVNDEK